VTNKNDSGIHSQSSENRNALVKFLTNKANNSKWLNYAQHKINVKSKKTRSGCLEAEDYISEVKVTILEMVTVSEIYSSFLRFTIIINGVATFMSESELSNYFLLLIKWKMANTFKRELRIIPLPQWDEDEEGEPASENELILCKDKQDCDFTVPFDDPFKELQIYKSKEFIEECYNILEKENPLYRMMFEELMNGMPNREIAKKLKLPIRRIENIRKKINRRVKKLCRDEEVPLKVCVPNK
jgi:hypothetical protein